MNLLENEELTKRSKKSKAIMTVIITVIILLFCLCGVIMYMIYDVQNNMLKLTIDKQPIASFTDDMFLFEGGTIYVSIKDFAKLVGYQVFNGDHTSEDATKGYIQNGYEEASYTLNSNKIYKNLLTETDNEYYNIEKPIKMVNNKLYMSIDGIKIATTCEINYNASNKKITVYTLPYLANTYTQAYKNSAIGHEKADFSNKKAALYNMLVITNSTEENPHGKYGVYDLVNKREIIGIKYASIKFVESTKEFIVTTDNKKMGILSAKGITKISPEYDEIKQIDKDLNLYLVKNNNKYGVINQSGAIVIHLEYDRIGVDLTQFASNKIKNPYLLYDNCIAVQRDNQWGFFDKTGKQIVPIKCAEVGCISRTQSSKMNNNLLIIPEYEAIVVGMAGEDRNKKKYGLINSLGKTLIPCALDSFYSITAAGTDTYYMIQGEKIANVIEWLEKRGIQKQKMEEVNQNQNTVSNQVTNTTTNQVTNNATNVIPNGTSNTNNQQLTSNKINSQNTTM